MRILARILMWKSKHKRAVRRRRAVIQMLASYVPGVVLRRSLSVRRQALRPELSPGVGCTLLADVSGFTKLAGYLASGKAKESTLDVNESQWGDDAEADAIAREVRPCCGCRVAAGRPFIHPGVPPPRSSPGKTGPSLRPRCAGCATCGT